MTAQVPKFQTAAVVSKFGAKPDFRDDYPVPAPGDREVLAKVLYTGVCQSDLHTKDGHAAGHDGEPILGIKFPHIGGHEGVARIVSVGPKCRPSLKINTLVGIRFTSRVCRECEFCLAGQEQHCPAQKNHLHHEDGSFQEYCLLDADYITVLPSGSGDAPNDLPERVWGKGKEAEAKWCAEIGPILCAGTTAYNAVRNCDLDMGQWLVIVGAAGGLGHLAIQYARLRGARVIAIDTDTEEEKKGEWLEGLGAEVYLDFRKVSVEEEVHRLTSSGGTHPISGAHAVIVTAASPAAFTSAGNFLRVGGVLSCVGIPPGKAFIELPVSSIVIKGLRIKGSLLGSLKDCMEAVELTRLGLVRPRVEVRDWRGLQGVYEELDGGKVVGRIVLKVANDS